MLSRRSFLSCSHRGCRRLRQINSRCTWDAFKLLLYWNNFSSGSFCCHRLFAQLVCQERIFTKHLCFEVWKLFCWNFSHKSQEAFSHLIFHPSLLKFTLWLTQNCCVSHPNIFYDVNSSRFHYKHIFHPVLPLLFFYIFCHSNVELFLPRFLFCRCWFQAVLKYQNRK